MQRDEPPSPLTSHTRKSSVRPFNASTRVDSIVEDEEDAANNNLGTNHKHSNSTVNTRNLSAENTRVVPPTRTISKPSGIVERREPLG